jgi:hypothetical protein
MAKDKLGGRSSCCTNSRSNREVHPERVGQTEADFAFFDLAKDKVELKSDGWRTTISPMTRGCTSGGTSTFTTMMDRDHRRAFGTSRDRARASLRRAAGNVQD